VILSFRVPMKDTVTALLTLDSGPMPPVKWQKFIVISS